MEVQAVVILSPLANGILQSIKSLVTSDIWFALVFRTQLIKIQGIMGFVQTVLLAAEKRQGEIDGSVRKWLEGLRDVLYDVDDLLDDISTEDLRIREENLHVEQVSDFFSKLTDRFQDVDKSLAYLINEVGRFNFLANQNQIVEDADKVKEHDFPFIYWSRVVGRDDERKDIIDFLTENRGRKPVVTISGDRGVGKTTLARSVVEDNVWEKSAPPIWCDNLGLNTTFEVLRNRLQIELGGKESLLVLDDVSYLTRAQCNELRDLLKVGVAGVMITTTNKCIADLVGESFTPCDEKGNEDEVQRTPTQSHNEGIGRREGKEQIMKFLLNNCDKQLSTLSIVGIMGHGNTLLESICQDKSVQSQFEYSKRVCVSCEEFNFKKIVEYILGDGDSDKTLERLQLELREELKQKKFLLVLEDMDMNPYQWDKLRDLLMNDKVGNKVLITARDKQVARIADSTIQLEPLYPQMRKHLEPLYVCDVYEKTNSSLKDIMKLGFDSLASSIKICLLYSVCFPVHPPSREKLTQQWIAQGFIEPPENNQLLLDLANKYFDVLLSRSFFYNLAQDDFMAETRFEVHDIVCDLAHLVSKGECSVTSSNEIENIPSSVHHVAVFNESKEEFPSSLMGFKKLRTFKWENFGSMSTTTLNVHRLSRTLRVLDLSCSVFHELTSSIDELNHLRYLDLSRNVYLESLPSSLFKLYNLETLRVDGCAIEKLPREIMTLRKLRNLYACTEQGSIAEGGICGLTSLRILHLDPIYNMETLPEGMQNLKLLETLVLKFCSNLSFSENDLKGLTSLRSLTITHLKKQSIIPRGLLDAASLSSLGLFYCVGLTSLPEWLGKLQCLRRLCVEFCPNLTASPEGICLPSGLQYLNIRGCPGLSRRFEGEDWPKISYIGVIHLEGKIVQLTPEIRLPDSSTSGKKPANENKSSYVFPSSSSYDVPMESAAADPVAPSEISDLLDEEMIESTSDAGLGSSNIPSWSSGPNKEGEMRIQSIPDPKSSTLPSSSKGSLEFISNSDFIAFRSRRSTMRLILKALRDESCGIVGVVGMGGVGKTAIVDEIAKKASQLNFDRVVKVVVTQTPNVKRIQAEIALVLNLRFHSEADELARADQLFLSLSDDLESILVILDDIWSSKDSVGTNLLDAVGIPYGVQHGGCKIILTTRREAVCDDMKIKEEHRATVDVLKDMESHDLFWKYEGHTFASFLENPTVEEVIKRREAVCDDMGIKEEHRAKVDVLKYTEFWKNEGHTFASFAQNSKVKEVIKECYGLPIALVTMGVALRGKGLKWLRGKGLKPLRGKGLKPLRGKEQSWISKWSKLRQPQLELAEQSCISKWSKLRQPQLEQAVYSCLKLSYNYIREKETKFCFLLCCLFPEYSDIRIEHIIRYVMGKGLFGDATPLSEVRERFHVAMKELTGSYLLLKRMSNRIPCLKMRRLVRNFAMSIASEAELKFFIEARAGFKSWPENNLMEQFTCISLMKNEIQELPEKLECPRLELLSLCENNGLQNIPNSCFQGMTMLQVLDLSKLYSEAATLRLPTSLECLESIRTLLLDHCKLEGDLSIIGKLVKLEILSLRATNIGELPVEIRCLTRLRLLDLDDCDELESIPANVISRLCSLEELYMKGGFRNWKVIEGGTSVAAADHERERNASLSEIQSLSSLTVFTAQVDIRCLPSDFPFGNSTKFDLTVSSEETSCIVQVPSFNCFSCNGYIVDRTEMTSSLLLKVEYLTLHDVEVKAILSDSDEGGFNALKSLRLVVCDGLKYLSDYQSQRRSTNVVFANLEELLLEHLRSMKGFGEGVPSPGSFQNLRSLQLTSCDKVCVVIPSNWIRNLPKLEQLYVSRCSSVLEIIEVAGIANEPEMTPPLANIKELRLQYLRELRSICKGPGKIISFSNLIELKISGCLRLASIFSPYMSQLLFHLQDLTIERCHNLRIIFEEAEEEVSMDEIQPLEFPELKIVPVQGCKQLKTVSFKKCPQLRSLFPVSIARRLVNLEELRISDCKNMVELVSCGNSTGTEREANSKEIQLPWLAEMEIEDLSSLKRFCPMGYSLGLSSLEELSLSKCPELVKLTSDNAASYGLIKIPTSARILTLPLRQYTLTANC